MISQISLSGRIYDALFKAKETIDEEFKDAFDWFTDIIESEKREKQSQCEICQSDKKLDQHHIRGRKHGNECITVCSGCHKTLTDKQRLWDRSWLEPNPNKDAFLIRGFIDICELKYERLSKIIYKLIAEKLTEGFSYD